MVWDCRLSKTLPAIATLGLFVVDHALKTDFFGRFFGVGVHQQLPVLPANFSIRIKPHMNGGRFPGSGGGGRKFRFGTAAAHLHLANHQRFVAGIKKQKVEAELRPCFDFSNF